MSYELQTKTHGTITAGYFGPAVWGVMMGNFAIPTDKFCDFVARLAVGETKQQVLTTDGKKVEGSWDMEKRIVKLGQYEIAGEEFGIFADYIFHGGLLGWKHSEPEWRPDFVKSAINYVKQNMSKQAAGAYINQSGQKELPTLEERV